MGKETLSYISPAHGCPLLSSTAYLFTALFEQICLKILLSNPKQQNIALYE